MVERAFQEDASVFELGSTVAEGRLKVLTKKTGLRPERNVFPWEVGFLGEQG